MPWCVDGPVGSTCVSASLVSSHSPQIESHAVAAPGPTVDEPTSVKVQLLSVPTLPAAFCNVGCCSAASSHAPSVEYHSPPSIIDADEIGSNSIPRPARADPTGERSRALATRA